MSVWCTWIESKPPLSEGTSFECNALCNGFWFNWQEVRRIWYAFMPMSANFASYRSKWILSDLLSPSQPVAVGRAHIHSFSFSCSSVVATRKSWKDTANLRWCNFSNPRNFAFILALSIKGLPVPQATNSSFLIKRPHTRFLTIGNPCVLGQMIEWRWRKRSPVTWSSMAGSYWSLHS